MNHGVLGLTFFILGGIVGAGFAGGKEVVTFFTQFGVVSFVLIIGCGVCFYFSFLLYLRLGKHMAPKNFIDVTGQVFKHGKKSINVFIFFSFVLVTGGMFAGVNSAAKMFNNKIVSLCIVTANILGAYFICIGGEKKLKKINALCMPIIIVLLVSICVLACIFIPREMANLFNLNKFVSMGSSFVYVGFNILLSGFLLLQVGAGYTIKQIKKACLYSSILITTIMLLINFTVLTSGNLILNAELPMLVLSFNIHNMWGVVTTVVVLFCIFTSITSQIYIIAKCMEKYIKSFKASCFFSIFICLGVSLIGFNNIVVVLYPVVGVFGVWYTLKLFLHLYKKTNKRKVL